MATILSHGIAAAAITRTYTGRRKLPTAFWITAVLCSMLPDLDVIGLRYGVHYNDLWGHRGMTHSLLAAAVLGLLAALLWAPRLKKKESSLGALWIFFFLVTASHGFLDAMTNGGLGVAFFSPFNTHRYFLAWRPIEVSPIGLTAIFHPRGWVILMSEIRWIWIPSAIMYIAALVL